MPQNNQFPRHAQNGGNDPYLAYQQQAGGAPEQVSREGQRSGREHPLRAPERTGYPMPGPGQPQMQRAGSQIKADSARRGMRPQSGSYSSYGSGKEKDNAFSGTQNSRGRGQREDYASSYAAQANAYSGAYQQRMQPAPYEDSYGRSSAAQGSFDPYADPYADPYGQPAAQGPYDPYAESYASSAASNRHADPYDPYTDPYADPYADPYQRDAYGGGVYNNTLGGDPYESYPQKSTFSKWIPTILSGVVFLACVIMLLLLLR